MMKGGCWGHLFELASTPSLARGFKLTNKNFIEKVTDLNGASSES